MPGPFGVLLRAESRWRHFGWITAAAALSWNGQIAAMGTPVEVRLTAALATFCSCALSRLHGNIASRGLAGADCFMALYGVSKGMKCYGALSITLQSTHSIV